MSLLESLHKSAVGRSAETSTKINGTFEVLARRFLGHSEEVVNFIDAFYGESAIFPGADAQSIKVLANVAKVSGFNPIDEEIRDRAIQAKKSAMNLKPMDSKYRELIIKNELPTTDFNTLNQSQKNTFKRIFQDAIEDNTFAKLVSQNPNIIYLAREVLTDSSKIANLYPYLLPSLKARQRAGVELARSNIEITDPNILRDPDICQAFLDAGGDKQKIITLLDKNYLLNTEASATKSFSKSADSSVEAALNIGLRSINQQLLCKNYLTQQFIQLRNNQLSVDLFQGLPVIHKIPVTDKNTIDFKRLTDLEQKTLIRYLENTALTQEFGTFSKNPDFIISKAQSMSIQQLADTNVGQEIVHANGGPEFYSRYSLEQQKQILAKAVSIRAIAHNIYSGGLSSLLVDHNSQVISKGIHSGLQSSAVFYQAFNGIQTALSSHKFDTPLLQQQLGATVLAQELEQLVITQNGGLNELLGVPTANDTLLLTNSPTARSGYFRQFSFALAQLSHLNPDLKKAGETKICELLKINSSSLNLLYKRLAELGKEELYSNYLLHDNNGQINQIHTQKRFLDRFQVVKKLANHKFSQDLENSKDQLLPKDYQNLVSSIDVENIDYFN